MDQKQKDPKPLMGEITSSKERRKPIQDRRSEMIGDLTDAQRFELRRYEQFGWTLLFVRHPLFERSLPVLRDRDTQELAILEPDGSLNHDHQLTVRPARHDA